MQDGGTVVRFLIRGMPVVQVPTQCSGIPAEILNPSNQWADKNEYNSTLMHLAELYKVRL